MFVALRLKLAAVVSRTPLSTFYFKMCSHSIPLPDYTIHDNEKSDVRRPDAESPRVHASSPPTPTGTNAVEVPICQITSRTNFSARIGDLDKHPTAMDDSIDIMIAYIDLLDRYRDERDE
jgi:hypothetical protein